MHTMAEFGDTKTEVIADNYSNIHIYMNQIIEEPMDLVLANTINGFSRYIRELLPDLIIVHGDRIEALAAAISGAINNILVGHVEGGEVSGTIDESLRHAISKLAHIHFVSNDRSKERLIQLGEKESSIFVIGSPDIDIIKSQPSLSLNQIKNRYDINFNEYAILIYHPVTTEVSLLQEHIKVLVDAVIDSKLNYVVIKPNNDSGYKIIFDEYKRFENRKNFKLFPSIRFEYFIELLKYSSFIIGNSSVGIHESPSLGIPTVNIGTRQNSRVEAESIISVSYKKADILEAIQLASKSTFKVNNLFGDGDSSNRFISVLNQIDVWNTNKQKEFVDYNSSLYKSGK